MSKYTVSVYWWAACAACGILTCDFYFGLPCLVATILMEGGSAHDLTILDDVDVEGRSEGIPQKDPATGEKSGVCV